MKNDYKWCFHILLIGSSRGNCKVGVVMTKYMSGILYQEANTLLLDVIGISGF